MDIGIKRSLSKILNSGYTQSTLRVNLEYIVVVLRKGKGGEIQGREKAQNIEF